MRRLLVISVAAAMLGGCASINKQPLSSAASATLKGQTVVQSSRKLPDFGAMTPGKAMFGVLGAVAMISEGNKLVATHQVADPANAIARELAAALASAHDLRIVQNPAPVSAQEASALAGELGGKARLLVDVQTVNWSFVYFPTNWSRYRVMYTANARLVDLEAKRVVAEGFCKRIPETDAGAPTYDELMAEGASGLKRELSRAADECVKSLKSEMLGI